MSVSIPKIRPYEFTPENTTYLVLDESKGNDLLHATYKIVGDDESGYRIFKKVYEDQGITCQSKEEAVRKATNLLFSEWSNSQP